MKDLRFINSKENQIYKLNYSFLLPCFFPFLPANLNERKETNLANRGRAIFWILERELPSMSKEASVLLMTL